MTGRKPGRLPRHPLLPDSTALPEKRCRLRQGIELPNLLSLSRLVVFVPMLWAAALFGLPTLVGWLLIPTLLTDALDGYLARRLEQVTSLGARLDSLADSVLLGSSAMWLAMYVPELTSGPSAMVFFVVLSVWIGQIMVGLLRFGRFANLHLYSHKVAAVAISIFLVHTFIVGFEPALFYLAAGSALLSCAEGILILLTRSRINERMGSILLASRKVAGNVDRVRSTRRISK